MFIVKWVAVLAFFVMVCASIYHVAREETKASQTCYIAAGVFVCSVFYATTLHKIFPKSHMGDRVADILEKAVDVRQAALMHHIQHNHQGDLAAMKQLQPVQHEDEYMLPSKYWRVENSGGYK